MSASAPPANPPPVDMLADIDQYYGTVSLDGITTSSLPILHWFTANAPGTEGTGGASSSFFFQPVAVDQPPPGYVQPAGRFYDNIPVTRHGQTSNSFPQKSHNVSFNKDNRLKWKDGEPNAQGINLLTTYADKSKIRHALAWDTWGKSGHLASHFAQPVRVQQNAAFRGLYDIVEDANDGFLERTGLDPEQGSLYKVYNNLDDGLATNTNANGSEKKNPDDDPGPWPAGYAFPELSAFTAGIADSNLMTDRLRFSYDHVDIASLVNIAATSSLILSRDWGHKNYYLYRDTAGTGEWSMLPWDQDLSFGHTYTGGNTYWDDDIHSQAPVQNGNAANRLLKILYGTNEFNTMYVARMRTLMDQFLVSATETNGPLEQKINALINAIDPNPHNPQTGVDDADLNARQWGFWVDGSSTTIPYTDSQMNDHTARDHANRILNSNPIPPYPGANPYDHFNDGSTSLLPFLPGRRAFLFANPAPTSGSRPIPASPPAIPPLTIESVDFNPTGGIPAVLPTGISDRQGFEYFIIRNPNSYAVDISGWALSGEVTMTFRGGTVIPGQGTATTQGTNSAYVNQLVLANKPQGFRQRTASPKASEYRYVAGPYKGQLSARGGTIFLNRPNNLLNPTAGYTQVASLTYTGAPTAPQQSLRITELSYHPADPTPGELATAGTINVSGTEHLTITFDRVSNALDLTFFVEAGNHLAAWPDAGILLTTTALGGGRERVTFRDSAPLSAGGRQMRVRAVKP